MRPLRLALAALLAGCAAAPEAERPSHRRSTTFARYGMVACAHPLAAQAGLEILRRGGNAVDAAIGVNAALGFLEPTGCGIGGDLFALVWDAKTRRLYGLNASGRCPAALTVDKVTPLPDGTIDPRSPAVWTVPGAADGWFELHARFGRLPMNEILEGPIRLARDGAPVPRVIAGLWKRAQAVLGRMPGFAGTFLPNGAAPKEGEIFRNPALAATYELLASGGCDAYYRGPVADAIVKFSSEHGGFFSREDFASHKSEWVEPIWTTYRGVTVYELPPNTQGLAALQMLNILENFDLRAMGRGSVEFWHTLIEAKKLAFEDRARYAGDPAAVSLPVEELLSKEYARKRASRIDPNRASRAVEAGEAGGGDTTYLAVGDGEGNLVSLIQSNYTGFGSGHAVMGFGLQNRGALFNLNPEHPNALRPGRRPFHTIIPAFASRGGKPWLAFGVMGGAVQPQGHVQVIVNLVDFDMDLQQAGDAPRFVHEGSSEPTGTAMTAGGRVLLEEGIPVRIRTRLERLGHVLGKGGSFGGYQAVAIDPVTGVLSGATESRKDGAAAGY